MADIRTIEGSPYAAKFIGQEDATQEHSYAYGIVEPPFTADEDTFNLAFNRAAQVTQLVTTESKVLLEIDVPDVGPRQPHDARLEIAYRGLTQLVKYLNDIENGTFEHY
jgi:hypothetical protein